MERHCKHAKADDGTDLTSKENTFDGNRESKIGTRDGTGVVL